MKGNTARESSKLYARSAFELRAGRENRPGRNRTCNLVLIGEECRHWRLGRTVSPDYGICRASRASGEINIRAPFGRTSGEVVGIAPTKLGCEDCKLAGLGRSTEKFKSRRTSLESVSYALCQAELRAGWGKSARQDSNL